MRTLVITKNLYTFDELSDEAKENALDYIRERYDFAWDSDNAETVKAIAEKCGWEWDWYSYDGIRYTISYDINDGDVEELSGARAMAYISNNYIDRAAKPKYYWLNHVWHCDGRKNWERKSKIWYRIDDCPFTGYYLDYCFAEAWRDWKKNLSKYSTVKEFADLVAEYLSRDWTADNEYQISDEGIREYIEANEYEFTEDGSLY